MRLRNGQIKGPPRAFGTSHSIKRKQTWIGLFGPDDSGRDTGEIAAVEACKVDGGGSKSFLSLTRYSF